MARLTIATSDISGAGTDANIAVVIFGSNGQYCTNFSWLDNPGDDFESGSIGVYDVNLFYITDVKGMLIYNSGGGSGPDWHVAWIRLEDPSINVDVFAEANEWIKSGWQYRVNLKPASQAWNNNIVIPQEVLARTPRPAVIRSNVSPAS
ncbi:MAG: hypothetical protein F6J87_04610 [Spirulina sp. SIO3F2]|nr:hypothetical protein [Spirulina sp. SIO3F2]